MQELSCTSCGNRVLVEKYSPTHTSVQWLEDSEASCPEFARKVAEGMRIDRIPTCVKLRASIEEAARQGVLGMDAPRSYPVPGQLG
ncbi:hypothetical protein [Rhodococcus kronopolitis]|uniref:Ferredoxin n=1 Tax=Rhodococcus kronopolitis TaxID=1460226 RepID=A0ABV9FPT0_9NOCA